jgi:hypothetical protein
VNEVIRIVPLPVLTSGAGATTPGAGATTPGAGATTPGASD